jgi:hypothetical protein
MCVVGHLRERVNGGSSSEQLPSIPAAPRAFACLRGETVRSKRVRMRCFVFARRAASSSQRKAL